VKTADQGDAAFCWEFVLTMQKLGTPHFNLLLYLLQESSFHQAFPFTAVLGVHL